MLFTKKLDKALEEISPYALPETTSSSNLACWTTCVEEDQCKNTVVQANGDPGAKKFYGPATVQAEMEVKPNELRSLPDLGRACLSVHEERFIGDKSRSNRNSRTFAVSPNGRVAISPSKIVESREQYPRLLEETGTCPTDYLHSCHLTRTITPASSLCQNQTIPLQISLGGRTISSVTTQSIPSIGIVSPESTNGRPSTVMGLANNSESKKSKCASLPWPPTASKQPLQLSGIAHCADDHVVPSSQAVHNVTEDETALPEGSTLVEGHSLPLPSNQDAQPGRQLQQRSSSHSETAYYSLSTNGMASDRGSCAFATEVPSNISLSDSNNLTSIPLKSSHYSQNGRTSNKLNKCAKPNSKESKLGAETGVHPSSPQPRKTRRPVSVTYVEPRSCGESTETLLSVAPQVAKLVESALLVRPDVQDLKDGEIPAIPRQRSCSRTPTPIYTPPPIKTTVVSSGKSSTSRGFISPQSIQREEECSFSSYHGDEISAQMKFIQEQLCLQSVSDPIDLAESPTSPCSASTSPITGASINKMSVDPRVYRDKIEATYSADDRARPKSRLNSGAAQKPDHNCGDLEGGSTSGTIWTQAQSWSVDPNNDNDLSNLVKPEIPFCVEEVHR
ncbi:hypothetical protein D915_001211 [Fasciola hepatica]|uniref:Uncharacterized protein n=1 Tax=Fasciola hepatica TaxID=6192 RepID=A0A4E0RZ57_FASHE|nr:hypothetical protein D915_001211 [Fasciola hepatica]